jgi:acyl-CoA reductase-like NAD-dependent aldehyde dehydrogenase
MASSDSKIAVKGRFVNCRQSCIASKRFIVVKDIAKEFTEEFVQKTDEQLKVGNPLADDTDLGPWPIWGVSKKVPASVQGTSAEDLGEYNWLKKIEG